jgi:hypothetical protein
MEPTAPLQTVVVEDPAPLKSGTSGFIFRAILISLLTFTAGFGGITGYYHFFKDTEPEKPVYTGETLGLTAAMEPTVPVPTSTPLPDYTLIPEGDIEDPYPGTLAYLKDGQIYTIKTDRNLPDQITEDDTRKNNLTPHPDSLHLAYTYTADGKAQDAGIAIVNRQTKAVTVLVEPGNDTFQQLHYSPTGRYLSVWANNGQEIIVFDTDTLEPGLRFGTQDKGGISPITWLPGQDQASFILKGELFVSDPQGNEIETLANNVVGIKIGPGDVDVPVPPVWSQNDKIVAFIRQNGLYLLNLDTRQETAVFQTNDDLALNAITFAPLAFTSGGTHLVFSNTPDEGGADTFAYSLNESKIVPLSNYAQAAITNPHQNQVLGLKDQDGVKHLAVYSLEGWEEKICAKVPFNYPLPPQNIMAPLGSALAGVVAHPGITALTLLNPQDCSYYEVVRAPTLSYPIWLPN